MIDPTILFISRVMIGTAIVGCVWLCTKNSKKKPDDNESIIFHIHHEY